MSHDFSAVLGRVAGESSADHYERLIHLRKATYVAIREAKEQAMRDARRAELEAARAAAEAEISSIDSREGR